MALRNFFLAIAILLALHSGAQVTTDTAFAKEWLRIDTLIVQNDLTRTALELTNTLYQKAKQQQLPAQVIKSLLYRLTLEEKITPDNPNRAIDSIQLLIATTTDETQEAILYALLAKRYRQYYNIHRWVLYNRKNVSVKPTDDIATWSNDDLQAAIVKCYARVLQNIPLLQQQTLAAYIAIIIKGNSNKPGNLFDLLANEALEYYQSGETYVTKPMYAFTISDLNALGGMDTFIQSAFTTPDKTSQQWLALRLFQQLLKFHRKDADKNILLQINIERIEWVYQHAVFASKEATYLAALEEMTLLYGDVAASSQAWYLLARLESNRGNSYRPFLDTTGRYSKQKAEQIILKALALYKESNNEVINLQNLLSEIRRKELRTETEKVNVPGKPFRALVSYRNVDTLYGRIIRIDNNQVIQENQWTDTYWKTITHLKPYQIFIQALPGVADHQLHSAEIKIDRLPIGEYALLSSSRGTFNDSLDKMSVQFFYVSNISYIKSNMDFFVLNRENGKPIQAAKVIISKQGNGELKKKYEAFAERKTDANGYFRFDEKVAPYRFRYEISKGNDRLAIEEDDYIVYENEAEALTDKQYELKHKRILFFTDRDMYRPGQQVFFKGIAITEDRKTGTPKLVTGTDAVWVYLNDVNSMKIDSVSLTLNAFGSFAGNFRLPANTLTGSFSVSAVNYSSSNFSVEEYKRPTFNVSFDKVKGAYRLNDSVTITGSAMAFAGNMVDGAKLNYTINRSLNYRAWNGFRNPGNQSKEIAHGEFSTDAAGRFTIRFKALADDITDTALKPLFDYAVTVDVTDNNGETRSSNTNIAVGYASLLLQVEVPYMIDRDSLTKLKVTATNLNNEKEPVTAHIRIFSLQAPAQPVRTRYWTRPDQFVMGRQEFAGYFPNDEYEQESNFQTWATEGIRFEETIDTKEKNGLPITPGSIQPGSYRVEATAIDKYGIEVKEIRFMQVFSAAESKMAAPAYGFRYPFSASVEPGQPASFYHGTSAERIFVIRKIDKPRTKTSEYSFFERKRGLNILNYIPKEDERGVVNISEIYVYDNNMHINQYTVYVPWTNKTLKVNYASYRDKTEPGSKEKWTVTITSADKKPADAELLTAMYDASLDQFREHEWPTPRIWEDIEKEDNLQGYSNFSSAGSRENYINVKYIAPFYFIPDRLAGEAGELWEQDIRNWLADPSLPAGLKRRFPIYNEKIMGMQSGAAKKDVTVMIRGIAGDQNKLQDAVQNYAKEAVALKPAAPLPDEENVHRDDSPEKKEAFKTVIRKDFNETAFFFPQLYADSSGKYSFSFTIPDALTQWKWLSVAHTKDLSVGSNSAYIITQKKLMVQANAPRFMREGDNMEFSAKISNLTDKEITGQVSLELFDPSTNTSVDGWLQNVFPSQYFTVEAGQSFGVKFPIQIPVSFGRPLGWRVVARSGDMSDGEENILPVVTNRMLVTESLPILLQNDTTLHFRFDKLLQTNSESLTHEGITVEYTTNPAWYAVQALPYLMEYPYECAEQTFNRFYANILASHIVNKQPAIKKIFEQWKKDSSSLKSNLQKNEELKQVLLQETPWVLQAENESQQKRNIALLFDMARLSTQNESLIQNLSQMQLANGSFSWFKGGYEDRYITNYILTGIGKLKRLGALTPDIAIRTRNTLVKAIQYVDGKMNEDYARLLKNRFDTAAQQISGAIIDYLYMRSFFGDIVQGSPVAYDYFYRQGKKFWIKQNSYYRAELGLIYYRNKEEKFAKTTILPALLENAVVDPKQGMYWKTSHTSYWYQSPIEHQSMMIAFMSEIGKDVTAMKIWLLLNKQTNNWKTTIATADACYALLLNGSDWLSEDKKVSIRLGNLTLSSSDEKTEAGTGYFKKRIEGRLVSPEMGNITVNTTSTYKGVNQPSWGSIYWQYFEDLDKITPSASPLSVNKKLFIETNTDKGKLLVPVKEGDELKKGDKVVIRMELRSDRDMEYLHLKDMRAASMEPVNVLSGFKWQEGLGYYESTKDVSSNFFISHLSKGTYVFEYPVFITHTGVFSVGIASIQCMYAPEFTSHSAGIKIRVN